MSGEKTYNYIGNYAMLTPQNWNFIRVDQRFSDIFRPWALILLFIIQIFMKSSTSSEYD